MQESSKNGHFTPEGGHEVKCGNITKTNDSAFAYSVYECDGCNNTHIEASVPTLAITFVSVVMSGVYINNQFPSTGGMILTALAVVGGAILLNRLSNGVTLTDGDQR